MNLKFEPNQILDGVRNRLWRENLDCIIIIVGHRGFGKSSGGITICSYIDRKFTLEKIVFTAKELMTLFDSHKLKRGSAVLLDEAGTFWMKRDALTRESKMLSKVFQICRCKNYALILTLPAWSMIDTHAQDMADMQLEAIMKNRSQKFTRFKIKNVEVSPTSQRPKVYNPFPKIKEGRGPRLTTIGWFDVAWAPNTLWRGYTKMKKERVDAMIHGERIKMDMEGKGVGLTKKEMIIDALNKGNKSMIDIAIEHNTAYDYVRQIRREMSNRSSSEKGKRI